jgi:hypothetical protein
VGKGARAKERLEPAPTRPTGPANGASTSHGAAVGGRCCWFPCCPAALLPCLLRAGWLAGWLAPLRSGIHRRAHTRPRPRPPSPARPQGPGCAGEREGRRSAAGAAAGPCQPGTRLAAGCWLLMLGDPIRETRGPVLRLTLVGARGERLQPTSPGDPSICETRDLDGEGCTCSSTLGRGGGRACFVGRWAVAGTAAAMYPTALHVPMDVLWYPPPSSSSAVAGHPGHPSRSGPRFVTLSPNLGLAGSRTGTGRSRPSILAPRFANPHVGSHDGRLLMKGAAWKVGSVHPGAP